MPPTGPTVPSGFTVPVIVTSERTGTPVIAAMMPAVNRAPADGPSM
jgi:hypothetical protein